MSASVDVSKCSCHQVLMPSSAEAKEITGYELKGEEPSWVRTVHFELTVSLWGKVLFLSFIFFLLKM
jgi:hypothetical protein